MVARKVLGTAQPQLRYREDQAEQAQQLQQQRRPLAYAAAAPGFHRPLSGRPEAEGRGEYAAAAEKNIAQLEAIGLGQTPVCMAKTQYSFSDDPTKLGRPTGFRLTIRDVYPSAGAGFVVALAGDIMTMPGLSKTPSAEAIKVHPDGTIEGLF